MSTVTVLRRFQIVVPPAMRKRLNLRPGDKLTVVEFDAGLRLLPALPPSSFRGNAKGINTDLVNEPDRAPVCSKPVRRIEGAIAALAQFRNFPARQQPKKFDEREDF
jgi:AbrB family looped-hinge helix DNA binding protein